MIGEDGEPVFFEGNMAVQRGPEYLSLSQNISSAFLAALAPL